MRAVYRWFASWRQRKGQIRDTSPWDTTDGVDMLSKMNPRQRGLPKKGVLP